LTVTSDNFKNSKVVTMPDDGDKELWFLCLNLLSKGGSVLPLPFGRGAEKGMVC